MKKILTLFAVVGLIAFSSCEGPEGPPGPPGYDGVGTVYENAPPNYYNFNPSSDPLKNFRVRFVFPQRIFDSDVVLVYRYGGVDSGRDVWEFLPETHYFDDGTRDFSFDFTFSDSFVDIYLNGNNLTDPELDPYRFNQIFRIVVVPADFAKSVNKANYLEVMKAAKLSESQVQKIKL
ncbi:hypothetical protein [Flavobacterium sp. F52]|uniref:hypothetical protein n=1 Tax=Flavobacterium sp. F52 TaxID=1202532 RepID=UPI000272F299|nr:hypothetical protein [Flavobacterium sp. F52]EJG02845.1 hypothetical protein FF52_01595 [Flavobacterium sp. F52]